MLVLFRFGPRVAKSAEPSAIAFASAWASATVTPGRSRAKAPPNRLPRLGIILGHHGLERADRHPRLRGLDQRVALEALGSDPHDLERTAFDQQAAADDGCVGLKSALPELVTDDYRRFAGDCVFLGGQEVATWCRHDAEHREVVRRDKFDLARDAVFARGGREVRINGQRRGCSGKRADLVAELHVIQVRHEVTSAALSRLEANRHQLRGPSHSGQGAEQDPVEDREDRRVRPNPDREGRDDGEGVSRSAHDATHGACDIPSKVSHR
jgi:hypothetical protein